MAKHESGPDKHTNRPVLDHVAAGEVRYISTEKNEAYFHVSTSMGVRTEDIESVSYTHLPLFPSYIEIMN